MNELNYVSALLLGVIQGITEFLPISSSGHLAIVQRRLHLDPAGSALLLFDVLAHMGTLLAIAYVFRRPAAVFLRTLVRDATLWRVAPRHSWRIALLVIAATMPTAVIGLTFQGTFESAFDRPRFISGCLVVTGVLLALLAFLRRGRRGFAHFGWWEAALIGIAQAMAIFPGISRSAATICAASYLGWRRQWAARFSFLIAVPAVVGGTLMKVGEVLGPAANPSFAVPWGPVIVGSAAALLVGIVALTLLLDLVRRGKLHYFAIYCWVAAGVVWLTTP